MNETTKNFFKSFEQIDLPKSVDKEYRLYYNESGDIVYATETKEDKFSLPYLVVDVNVYNNNGNYVVKDKKLVKRSRRRYIPQLSSTGFRVAKGHSALLLKDDENIEYQYYEW